MISAGMKFLPILFLMLLLAPFRSTGDARFRIDLATAIAFYEPTDKEAEVLVRLAWYESAFRPDVARCQTTGDHGKSLGLFQIQPQNPYDRRAACGSLFQQVQLALQTMRRAAEACPKNEGADELAMYASGTCRKGIPEARHRWGFLTTGSLRQAKASAE